MLILWKLINKLKTPLSSVSSGDFIEDGSEQSSTYPCRNTNNYTSPTTRGIYPCSLFLELVKVPREEPMTHLFINSFRYVNDWEPCI